VYSFFVQIHKELRAGEQWGGYGILACQICKEAKEPKEGEKEKREKSRFVN
jgi:hypothetical protein